MSAELRAIFLLVGFLVFLIGAIVSNVRADRQPWAIALVSLGLALVTLPPMVDAFKAT